MRMVTAAVPIDWTESRYRLWESHGE